MIDRDQVRILTIDDERHHAELVAEALAAVGYKVDAATSGREGLERLRQTPYDLLIADLKLPDIDGIDLIRQARTIHPFLAVIVVTGHGTVESAVEAMQQGASDYLQKPVEIAALRIRVQKALEGQALRRRTEELERQIDTKFGFEGIIGSSTRMHSIIQRLAQVAGTDVSVLITGESGTGKELAAKAIHSNSRRRGKVFVPLNCAALSGGTLESELFGHEKGAFTGADRRKIGRFEQAHGGTLFLDEIGNMAKDFQEKILRVLEYQRFERVAGTETIETDVRVVAATNADLGAMMKEGRFRPDLYDRLSFKELRLPGLSERHGDIPLLVEHFRRRISAEVSWVAERRFTDPALAVLGRYPWPGNVRQLKNVVERLLCAGDDPVIEAAEVARELEDPERSAGGFKERIEALERQLVLDALLRAGGNQRAAADSLELTYDQLRHLYKKYRIKDLLADDGAPAPTTGTEDENA